MEAPQSPTNSNLTTEASVSLLESLLAEHKFRPSDGLGAFFEQIALLGLRYSSSRNQISSRFLFFVMAEAGSSDRYDEKERKALLEFHSFLAGSADYAPYREAYFQKEEVPSRTESPRLTLSVEQLLMSAMRNASERGAPGRVVDVTHVLRSFPRQGSKAEALMAEIGADPNTWRARAAERAPGWEALTAEGGETSGEAQAQYAETTEPLTESTKSRPPKGRVAPPRRKSTESAPKAPPRRREVSERVFTHPDEPAIDDRLGRKPFAEVLAGRIREARASGGNDGPCAFVAHLHGPWGSGKSSVLNFLEQELSEDAEPWLVVRFDAWRNQRLQPPWWSLITTIYATARRNLNWRRALRLKIRWLLWRIRADYVPLIAVVACATALLFLLFWVGPPGTPTPGAKEDLFANWLDKILKLVAGAITIIGAVVLWSRSLAMGSQRAAQAYADLKTDPYGPIARLFDRLIDAIDQPVVVFVDDLDRCDSKYVVDLLEGIQTLMRGAAVTYVVAGDRKWICSSFEQRYGAFSPPIGEPGRPLGYLFLDKIFQISAAIPQPGAEAQLTYWNGLLDPNASPERRREKLVEAQAKAEADAGQLTRQEDLQTLVADAEQTGDSARIQATRAAAAKRIASQPAAAEAEHRLKRYVDLLEPNPRAMKRLVNAYGMHQAALFLAGRTCQADALARWTILELRWPLLADFLANRPDCAGHLYVPLADDALPQVPDSLRDLFGDELVTAVIGPKRSPSRLSATAIRSILGASQGER